MKNRKHHWNLLFILIVILTIAFVGAHVFLFLRLLNII